MFGNSEKAHREYLKSPSYFAGPQKELEWYLHLYPQGDASVPANTFISIHPMLIKNKSAKPVQARFQISILVGSLLVVNSQSFSVYIKAKQPETPQTFPEFARLNLKKSLISNTGYIYEHCELVINCIVTMNYSENFSPEYNVQNLCDDFESLYRDQKHSDVTFVVREKKIPAHKCILASRSRVFEAMFDHDMNEKKNNVVNITDIDCDVFEDFLLFLYSGSCKFLDENNFDSRAVCDLLSTADKYDVTTLKKACVNRLKHNINIDIACEILLLANVHDVDRLKQYSIDFINANASPVTGTAGWTQMLNTSPILIADLYVAKVGKARNS